MSDTPLRRWVRSLGIGRAQLALYQFFSDSPRQRFKEAFARRLLPHILSANPIPADKGPVEVHMLLNHARGLEGLWALYSFLYFAPSPCRIVIHDDGTLETKDTDRLRRLFPGCRIIDRKTADETVLARLEQERFPRCARFRKQLVFSLKLLDPFFFLGQENFILLDSDVLFFSAPRELLEGFSDKQERPLTSLYLHDPALIRRYILPEEEAAQALGKALIPKFNPGVLRTHKSVLQLGKVEAFLENHHFWENTLDVKLFSELTLWAMLLSLSETKPLDPAYGFSYSPKREAAVCTHYCGELLYKGLFYSEGIPRLHKRFLA